MDRVLLFFKTVLPYKLLFMDTIKIKMIWGFLLILIYFGIVYLLKKAQIKNNFAIEML